MAHCALRQGSVKTGQKNLKAYYVLAFLRLPLATGDMSSSVPCFEADNELLAQKLLTGKFLS